MERLRNQTCLLGVQKTKTDSHTVTCSQQCLAAFRALCSQITDFLHIMNSNTHLQRLPQTYTIAQTHCSHTNYSFRGGMRSFSPDLLWFQIFTVSVTLSETHSPPKNSESQLDILCALLFYANHSECWSSETSHVMLYTLTTLCCSAGWKRGREAVR